VADNLSASFALSRSEEVIVQTREGVSEGQRTSSGIQKSVEEERSWPRVSLSGFSALESEAIRVLLSPYNVEISSSGERANIIIIRGSASRYNDSEGRDGESLVIPYEIVNGCAERLDKVLHPKISTMYKVSTKLPIAYNIVPSSLRSKLLKNRQSSSDSDLLNHLSFEIARRKVKESFEKFGIKLARKKLPSITVTHDIETEKGLERAISLKRIEDDLGVRSTWFVVSHEYPIKSQLAKEIGDCSEIGSHDVKHDGRLIHLGRQDELVKRLQSSRSRLGYIFERDITSFRAPLLQFNESIVSALGEAGYKNDFSLPCWESMHPSTMSGFGIESACSFDIAGIYEHPLSLFQDHQVLYVMGLSTAKTVNFWMEQIRLVRSFQGDVVLLVHPDYAFADDLDSYRKLLESIQI
jgi:peptidoglycan/xylan/chitin deacetylase (PgdA/CDA1 family)